MSDEELTVLVVGFSKQPVGIIVHRALYVGGDPGLDQRAFHIRRSNEISKDLSTQVDNIIKAYRTTEN